MITFMSAGNGSNETAVGHRRQGRTAVGLSALSLILCVLSGGPSIVFGQIGLSFTGSSYGKDSFAVPSDAALAAGPSNIVEMVNGTFNVYAKGDGSLQKTMSDSNFWYVAGVTFPKRWDVTDPRLVYDQASQRWFAVEIDYDPLGLINTNQFLLAISAGADPTGKWNGVAVPATSSANNFADFPTFGLDAEGVYLSGDLFDAAGNPLGPTLVSLPKAGLLQALPSIADRTSFGVMSYQQRGYILQPAVCIDGITRGQVLSTASLGFDYDTGNFVTNTTLFSFLVQNAPGPGKASLSGSVSIAVPGYTAPINPPQPDGSDNLDDGDARLSSSVYSVGGVLHAAHGTQVNGRSAIRWYRIRAVDGTLLESGTIQDPNLDFFYPAIAANANGRIVIGFNGCSAASFISCYAVIGEVTGGTTRFGDLLLLKAGVASYQNTGPDGTSRWGDYTAACVDPSDPDRFWLAQQYASARDSWSTRITEIITGGLRLNIAETTNGIALSWPRLARPARLQQTSSLTAPGSWTFVNQVPVTNAGIVTVSLPVTNQFEFYRLVQP